MSVLTEEIRPTELSEVVGQSAAVAMLERLLHIAGTLAGRAYWIAGPSGCGKTTLARIIAGNVANELGTVEIDAGELTPNMLAKIVSSFRCRCIDGTGHAVIVNEAHGLRKDTMRLLLTALEQIPGHAVWCFTTTGQGQRALFESGVDGHPLVTRCVSLPITACDSDDAVDYLMDVANEHGLVPPSYKAVLTRKNLASLLRQKRGSLRGAINALESGEFLVMFEYDTDVFERASNDN